MGRGRPAAKKRSHVWSLQPKSRPVTQSRCARGCSPTALSSMPLICNFSEMQVYGRSLVPDRTRFSLPWLRRRPTRSTMHECFSRRNSSEAGTSSMPASCVASSWTPPYSIGSEGRVALPAWKWPISAVPSHPHHSLTAGFRHLQLHCKAYVGRKRATARTAVKASS